MLFDPIAHRRQLFAANLQLLEGVQVAPHLLAFRRRQDAIEPTDIVDHKIEQVRLKTVPHFRLFAVRHGTAEQLLIGNVRAGLKRQFAIRANRRDSRIQCSLGLRPHHLSSQGQSHMLKRRRIDPGKFRIDRGAENLPRVVLATRLIHAQSPEPTRMTTLAHPTRDALHNRKLILERLQRSERRR